MRLMNSVVFEGVVESVNDIKQDYFCITASNTKYWKSGAEIATESVAISVSYRGRIPAPNVGDTVRVSGRLVPGIEILAEHVEVIRK